MPRYLVERHFPEGLELPLNETGTALCRQVVANNAEERVTWLHSYATPASARSASTTVRRRRQSGAQPSITD